MKSRIVDLDTNHCLNKPGSEGGIYVVDYCGTVDADVGSGNGFVVHHWRVYSHPAGARGHIRMHTADQRKARGLKR
jgi:hypothetical protein